MKEKLICFLEALNIEENSKLIDCDIVKYVDKIEEYATIISIFNNDHLIALIAFYENDSNLDLAFLSMLAVRKDFKKMGIGKNLLNFSIKELKKKGFNNYGLEVRKDNINAIKLYEKYGFIYKEERKNNFIYMEKSFKL